MVNPKPLVNVFSVQHSGTMFFESMLQSHGFWVKTGHWHNTNMQTGFVMSPIRHPKAVFASWYSRSHFGPDFFGEWHLFNEVFLADRTFIVPIDTSARDARLADLSAHLGRELVTDWEPMNEHEHYEPPQIDLSGILNLEVVRAFYE